MGERHPNLSRLLDAAPLEGAPIRDRTVPFCAVIGAGPAGLFAAETLARAHGLETCPQQAWTTYGAVVHRELAIPPEHILLSGMALGREDASAPENTLVTEREPVDQFTTWHN